ncbi:hypothetical protein RRG08_033603 [Elysia crispata]|uniref:Uncharacterized protein n=1 Tax=Elysia crispata TaxID=231223 RepID=A0AAE0XS68_9GAST|nr:hypothetical protein RRG08_033603 [Elysia crispata]
MVSPGISLDLVRRRCATRAVVCSRPGAEDAAGWIAWRQEDQVQTQHLMDIDLDKQFGLSSILSSTEAKHGFGFGDFTNFAICFRVFDFWLTPQISTVSLLPCASDKYSTKLRGSPACPPSSSNSFFVKWTGVGARCPGSGTPLELLVFVGGNWTKLNRCHAIVSGLTQPYCSHMPTVLPQAQDVPYGLRTQLEDALKSNWLFGRRMWDRIIGEEYVVLDMLSPAMLCT